MNAATEFDAGPLTWVKSEIDLALGRALSAFGQFETSAVSGVPDQTQIRFCRTHLHQVRGALTIVGLDGVTRFVEALEGLLEAIETADHPVHSASGFSAALVREALQAISFYIGGLVNGQTDQPLRLLPLYQKIQAERGVQRYSAVDLFFPDLSVRPPRQETQVGKPGSAEYFQRLKKERARFQRGLLDWLRVPENRNGVREMLAALQGIEETQESGATRAFWWAAGGFLAALAEGGLQDEASAKLLCARIDLQIRRLLEGSKNVAERLMRNVLYLVAGAASDAPAVRRVKETYRLAAYLPSADDSVIPVAAQAAVDRLREVIQALEESWNKFCAGSAPSLPVFKENAGALSGLTEQIGHTDYRRLAQAVAVAAGWLMEEPARHSEALAMELATAILLAQNAQKNYPHLGGDFAHQVDVTVERIHACIAGSPPQPGSEIPLLDEMSRRAQEKLLIGQVAKEIQNNLIQIEQGLDDFFRDEEKRSELADLEKLFLQIIGALTMLRQEGAVAALQTCLDTVRRFACPGYAPGEDEFEQLAGQLSIVGFFIKAMPGGETDFGSFVREIQKTPLRADADIAEEDSAVFVEHQVVQSRRKTRALLEALREQPEDAGLREGVRQNLETLKSDADLVADAKLGEQAKAMLSALASGADVAPRIEQAMAALKPEAAEASPPSQETLQLSLASNEEIDAELLDIFLDEAKEVMAAVDKDLHQLKNDRRDGASLTGIRRSFHTLKGSGRMVGLKELGEAAWAVEQTLNLWLRLERAVDSGLIDLLGEASGIVTGWIAYLETRTGTTPDSRSMVERAEALRAGAETGTRLLMLEEQEPAAAEEEVTESAGENVGVDIAQDTEFIQIDFVPLSPEETTDVLASAAPLDAGDALSALGGQEIQDAGSTPDTRETPATEARESGIAKVIPIFPSGAGEPALVQSDSNSASETRQQRVSISQDLFRIFSEEARAHLYSLRRDLPVLESDDARPTPQEMFRAAHTLAGISATVGLLPIHGLGHALERALQRRDGSENPGSAQAIGTIRRAIGELESMFSALMEQRDIEVPADLIEELDGLYLAGGGGAAGSVSAAGEEESGEKNARRATSEKTQDAPCGADVSVAPPAPVFPEIAPVRDEIDAQLLPIFLEEAAELTEAVAERLRAWRAVPGNGETVRILARQLHTLKGSARMAGAMTLGEITHALEARIDEASRADAVSPDIIDGIESAFESVRQIIERLQRGETIEAADSAPDMASGASWQARIAMPVPLGVERRADRSRLNQAEAEGDAAQSQATLRIRASVVDRLVNDAGELSITRSRIEGEMRGLKESLLDLTENVIRLRRQLREIEMQAELQIQSRTAAQGDEKHAGFDPLEFDRFTRFQELTRMMAESVNDVSTVQQHLLKNLDDANSALVAQARQNREMQQKLLSMRMVPFNSLADRLYRVLRQASKDLDKRVNMEIKGGQIELDRSVLDKIAAPLEHMLRNAIAHGIEKHEERDARGKPEIGEIALSLKQESNEIVLVLSDDGAGLDYERIRERAVLAGLLGADEAADQARLAEFIFTPGFSTAESLSQIAGRGVGMDVVKTEITGLGGRVEIESAPEKGSEFRLFLPLTLAVTKALLIRAGGRTFAIPSSMIEQVLDIKEADLERIRQTGAAEWQSRRYPFSYLPHLLGDSSALPKQHWQYWVLLLRGGSRRIGVQVDELLGNQEIVVKNVGAQLARVAGVNGATVLGNGQVVLILNPVALSMRTVAETSGHTAGISPRTIRETGKSMQAALPTVMIVDDSLTVRKITGRLMAREGYEVVLARDGIEALERLLDVTPDVMLVDIEMPRMDGFDLTRSIRADERFRHVPIIMITSRMAEKHRNYAFEIGVNHYLGKPYQEEELLRLVAGYMAGRRPGQKSSD